MFCWKELVNWSSKWIKQKGKIATMTQDYILFDNAKKTYGVGDTQICALDNVSFSIGKGEFCVLLGSSGAGKTTLLNMLGGMDTVTSGEVIFDGKKISDFGKRELTEYRRHDVGFR